MDDVQSKIGFSPLLWVVGKIIDITSPGNAASKQAEAARDIIREGHEHGVDSMTIVMDEQAGAQFSVPIKGVEISASLGNKRKITINVKYK